MTFDELAELARSATKLSYSPYSGFTVGAALLCADGTVFTGANVENAAYSASVCAERTAFLAALMSGKREFEAIAIAGKPADSSSFTACAPCGECRQVMREFCGDDFKVILSCSTGITVLTLSEVLPCGFSRDNLM